MLSRRGIPHSFTGHGSMSGLFFSAQAPTTYRNWKLSDYTFYDTMAGILIDMGVMCEPDSREPWFMCEAHAEGDIVDRVVSIFEDSFHAALENRAHGAGAEAGHGAMSHPAAG